ncbi:DUF4179 domain-containing protein [Neobacillus niacini]|uniref:DUF4179 domain-containing protein n=1 Tax=Neobacillus niacini TaxID=86668 RepID=UPI002DB808CB|nr:DUF4179 domain-containing protein [Neobacillus niacini]MEC1526195.1 DUF4179 domain-containing protein [Neobacillus niacini]
MKDIYQLLNDINLDESEFEEMEVSALEKTKVKRALKKSIIKNNQTKAWKKNIAAASILVGLTVTSFVTLPAYARNNPVIEDIFRFFDYGTTGFSGADKEGTHDSKDTQKKDIGLYYEYKQFSSEINMTKESNGIKFTVNNAVFDGKTVTLTYTIESEQELGNAGITSPVIQGMAAMGGTSKTTKIDTNKYIGILTVSSLEDIEMDVANVKWNIDSINNPDSDSEIKGDWRFAFSLNAVDSKMQLSDSSSEKNGVKVDIEKISVTPMSFIVDYSQDVSQLVTNTWDGVNVDLEIKDDLGNIYSGEGNGGKGSEGTFNFSWSKTFEKLDQRATKLIITPYVTFRDHNSDTYTSVEETKTGVREIPLPYKPGKGKEEFTLEDIIIDLEK